MSIETYIINLKDRFSGPMNKANASATAMNSKMKGLSSSMLAMGTAAAGAFAVMGASRLVSNSIKNFNKQAQAVAQVEQGLLSTGNVAGKTSQYLQSLASKMQTKSLFGDEDILQNATAQILTFTNITGDNFDKVQQAALDVSSRLYGANASGETLRATSIMLGKALNDPVANLGALSRAGIQFSEGQKETIKNLAKTNRLSEAQALIVAELNKQYGGSAEALARVGLGPMKQFQMRLGDISEEIGAKLVPHLLKFVDWLDRSVTWIQNHSETILKWYRRLMFIPLAFIRMTKSMVDMYRESSRIRGFFGGLGAIIGNLDKRIDNTIQRFKNLTLTITGRGKQRKQIEKVGESLGQAWKRGFSNAATNLTKKTKDQTALGAFGGGGIVDDIDVAGSGGKSTPTTIQGSAPKVFNINIDKLIEGFTISTTNLTESAGQIKEKVTMALAEALADLQLMSS